MTYNEMRDETLGILSAAIISNTSQLLTDAIDFRWPGMIEAGDTPPKDGYWGRCFLTTIKDEQSSLSSLLGIKRYEGVIQLVVQVFSPISLPGSSQAAIIFAESIRNAFCQPSPSGELMLTKQQVREAGNNETHYLTNVYAFITYTNIH